ncbi:MAG: DUF87 domain-containing protein [Candidatus Hydrogenedentes bacterium]|nr:DUF87 domain-containing protein [Candidatus Hydrogenedentota bacterium]
MGELEALRQVDFNWVVHPDLVWDDELPDAPGLHGNICDDIIDAARNLKGARPALGRLLLGPAGAGKTHLLAMLRRRASREGMTFVMADLTDVRDFFETLLLGFVVSLHQPDASGHTQLHSLFVRLIGALSSTVDPQDYVNRLAVQKPEGLSAAIADILRNLQVRDAIHTAKHRDVVRATVLLHARNFEVNSVGSTWLQGSQIEDDAKARFGFSTIRQKPSEIVQGLSWLASLCGPTIIAIDQLDPIIAYNRQAARAERVREEDESVELAKKILNDLCNGLGGLYSTTLRTVPVVTCLESSFGTLREFGLQSNLDRFEPPESLPPLGDVATAKAMIQLRLERAYAAQNFNPPHPTWPFAPTFFEGAVGLAPRELLKRCDGHRRACNGRGRVTELRAFTDSLVEPSGTPETTKWPELDERFQDLRGRADIPFLLEEGFEDERLARLLVTAAACLVKEAPPDDAHDVVVDSEFPGRNRIMPLHARIRKIELATGAEQHFCLRAMEKTHAISFQARLRAAMTSSGIDRKLGFRHLVLFRSNPLPGGEVTAKRLSDFYEKGGVLMAPEPDEIATLWALQQMSAEAHEAFDGWLIARKPAHNLRMLRSVRLNGAAGLEAQGGSDAPPDSGTPAAPPQATAPSGNDNVSGASDTTHATASPPAPPPQPKPSIAGVALPVGRQIIGGEPRGAELGLPLLELRKHTAIFAGAGSGKTVLIKRLVEEAALLGVPAIVIDTANDLAQLGDPWPDAPESLRPEEREKAERFFETTETVVWTPGLEGGNPLRLEPLPDFSALLGDVDALNDALAMAREALADIVAPGNRESTRNRLGVLTAALRFFAEQGGGNLENLVELLNDLPTGADANINDARKYASKMADALRSQLQIDPMLASGGDALDPAALFGLDPAPRRTRISVINFVGLPALDQQQQFLNRLAMTLFSWIKKHPADSGTLRGLLVLDEAKDFIPAMSKSPCRDSFMRLAAQARKYGLGLIFATQAPREIHNSIVTNCSTSFYGKGNAPAVINAIKELLQNKGAPGDDVARLAQGQFYVHNADVTRAPVKVATNLCLSHHREPLAPQFITELARRSRP